MWLGKAFISILSTYFPICLSLMILVKHNFFLNYVKIKKSQDAFYKCYLFNFG